MALVANLCRQNVRPLTMAAGLGTSSIKEIGTAATILYLKPVTFARSLASSLPLRGRSVDVLAVPKAAVQMS